MDWVALIPVPFNRIHLQSRKELLLRSNGRDTIGTIIPKNVTGEDLLQNRIYQLLTSEKEPLVTSKKDYNYDLRWYYRKSDDENYTFINVVKVESEPPNNLVLFAVPDGIRSEKMSEEQLLEWHECDDPLIKLLGYYCKINLELAKEKMHNQILKAKAE